MIVIAIICYFLFNKKKEVKNDFEIEHYPLTGKYYPKYKGNYLKRDFDTGIYRLEEPKFFMYADSCRTESEARGIISMFKEQQLKENVKTIKY